MEYFWMEIFDEKTASFNISDDFSKGSVNCGIPLKYQTTEDEAKDKEFYLGNCTLKTYNAKNDYKIVKKKTKYRKKVTQKNNHCVYLFW